MESEQEKPEGLDEVEIAGWGDYPLDSVFVRTEQRTVSEVVKRIDAGRFKLDPEFQGFFREFGLPAFDGVARRRGITGRDRVGSATIKVCGDDFYIFCRVRVAHGGGRQVQVVREGFRHHVEIGEPGGLQVRAQIGSDEGVERRGRPKAGIVAWVVVGLILDGECIGRKAVGVLASGDEAC